MAARSGVVTQMDLGENLRRSISNPIFRWLASALVICAIVIGNSAYQGGNISGASLGITSMLSDNTTTPDIIAAWSISHWSIIIGILAFIFMWQGNYAVLEKILIVLVAIMSVAFLTTFVITNPNLSKLFHGAFVPTVPTGATLTVIALVGTTVVPYNLFLHAASAKKRWSSASDLKSARTDLLISIPLGGLISIAILSTAASAFFGHQVELHNASDIAPALAPVFGSWAKIMLGVGLFSAGLSSAVTAPLAAAFALSGILGLKQSLHTAQFRLIWLSILIAGVAVSSTGYKPVSIILFAQVANGILLPVITVFLLWLMNQPELKQYKNTTMQNILGLLILLVTLLLSSKSLLSVYESLNQ